MTKIPFAGIELTSQRVRGLRGTSELPGDRLHVPLKYRGNKNFAFGWNDEELGFPETKNQTDSSPIFHKMRNQIQPECGEWTG